MILLLFLIAAVVFVPPFYQKKFFAEYPTVSKGKGFLLGLGYWGILVWLTLMPILVASEYGTVATVITAITMAATKRPIDVKFNAFFLLRFFFSIKFSVQKISIHCNFIIFLKKGQCFCCYIILKYVRILCVINPT